MDFLIEENYAAIQTASNISIGVENQPFDIKKQEEQIRCFNLLKYFILKNTETSNHRLAMLLNFPSMRALAHRDTTEGFYSNNNPLLRLALRKNNHKAVTLLLDIPKVRELAKQHDYYPHDVSEISLKTLIETNHLIIIDPAENNNDEVKKEVDSKVSETSEQRFFVSEKEAAKIKASSPVPFVTNKNPPSYM